MFPNRWLRSRRFSRIEIRPRLTRQNVAVDFLQRETSDVSDEGVSGTATPITIGTSMSILAEYIRRLPDTVVVIPPLQSPVSGFPELVASSHPLVLLWRSSHDIIDSPAGVDVLGMWSSIHSLCPTY